MHVQNAENDQLVLLSCFTLVIQQLQTSSNVGVETVKSRLVHCVCLELVFSRTNWAVCVAWHVDWTKNLLLCDKISVFTGNNSGKDKTLQGYNYNY